MDKLLEILDQLHTESYKLLEDKFNRFFPNAGNVGVFCQDDRQFTEFSALKEKLTRQSENPNQKYFKLKEPIRLKSVDRIPEVVYTHLYIRKPDPTPYGKYIGDIDFYTTEEELDVLKGHVNQGVIPGTEIYLQSGVGELIQISDSTIGTVAYISTKKITEDIRIKH